MLDWLTVLHWLKSVMSVITDREKGRKSMTELQPKPEGPQTRGASCWQTVTFREAEHWCIWPWEDRYLRSRREGVPLSFCFFFWHLWCSPQWWGQILFTQSNNSNENVFLFVCFWYKVSCISYKPRSYSLSSLSWPWALDSLAPASQVLDCSGYVSTISD